MAARIVNRLPQFVETTQHRAARSAYAAVTLGAAEAAAYTPQHTGNLINSQYKTVDRNGSRVVGRVGYTAEYALWVHEAEGKLKGQPRPRENGRAQGNYWDPRGEPEYLRRGINEAAPAIARIIKGALRV